MNNTLCRKRTGLFKILITIAVFLTSSPLSGWSQENSVSVDDSIPEFDRKIESVVFVPKGQWITGVSVSYSQSSQSNYSFLVLENLNGDTYSFNLSPMLLYAVKDDLALGGKFGYSRSLTKLKSAELNFDPETSFGVDHLYSLSHSYWGMAVMRNYFSLGRSKRFGFFNEMQLKFGGGQSKLTTGAGADISGTYSTNFFCGVGLAPGLMVFLNNYSALEVNVGVLGFNYSKTHSKRDQIYSESYGHQTANFRINLFSITFGVGIYL